LQKLLGELLPDNNNLFFNHKKRYMKTRHQTNQWRISSASSTPSNFLGAVYRALLLQSHSRAIFYLLTRLKLQKPTLQAFVLAVCMAASMQASAVTYYVKSSGGSDGFTGTSWLNAFATLGKATQQSDATIIYVGAGNYSALSSTIGLAPATSLLIQGGYPTSPLDATFNAVTDYAPTTNLTKFTTSFSPLYGFQANNNNTTEVKGLIITNKSGIVLFRYNSQGNLKLTDMVISGSATIGDLSGATNNFAVDMGGRGTNQPSLTVTNSLFAHMKGAIYVNSSVQGTVTVEGSTFTEIGRNGGGNSPIEVYGIGSLTVNNSTFCTNNASYSNTSGSTAAGGAMSIQNSTSTITNCKIYSCYGNTNWSSGGIYFKNGSMTVTGCYFKNNIASGGGVASVESAGSTFTNNFFEGNTGAGWPTIYNFPSPGFSGYPYTETGTSNASFTLPTCPTGITVAPAVTLTKAASPTTFTDGGTTTYTWTFVKGTTGAATNIGFSDALPLFLRVGSTPNVTTTGFSVAPTISAVAGTQTITVSGGSIAAATTTATISISITNIPGQLNAACPNANFTNAGTNITGLTGATNSVGAGPCVTVTLGCAATTGTLQ
jgi:hypothetical protein